MVPPTVGEHGREQVERFLAAGVRTLSRLGITTETVVRTGRVRDEILAQMKEGGHDLLVLGAPLGGADGRGPLAGLVGQIVGSATTYPVLIVRSRYVGGNPGWIAPNGRVHIAEEVIR